MTKLPSLPLFVDEYEAATAHLTLEEDGAYNRLLRLLWREPGCSIPADDAWIMRKMRCDSETYDRVIRPILKEFFQRSRSRWSQKRLSKEYAYVSAARGAKAAAGRKGGTAKALKNNKSKLSKATVLPEENPSKALAPHHTTPSSFHSEEDGGDARAVAELEPNFRVRILAAMRLGPDGIAGPSKFLGGQGDMAEANRWLTLPHITEDVAVNEIAAQIAAKRDGPPSRFSYFTPGMQRLSAQLSAPPLTPAPHPSPSRSNRHDRTAFDRSVAAVADGLADGSIKLDHSSRDPFAGL